MGLRGKGCPVRAGKAAAVLDAYLSRQLTVPAYPWDLGHLIGFCTDWTCPALPLSSKHRTHSHC